MLGWAVALALAAPAGPLTTAQFEALMRTVSAGWNFQSGNGDCTTS